MIQIKTKNAPETVKFGECLGQVLQRGDVLTLSGDLGAGKTAFTGGIAKALGVEGYVTSPTFTIINEYEGRIPLYHFDVYRINDPEEMFEIGFDDYLDGDGIVVIEWAELIQEAIHGETIHVDIRKNPGGGDDDRLITLEFIGDRGLTLNLSLEELLNE